MHVIATAGHVDHGKSTLVRALTGMEPDRWAEEKRRGLTIDLGFGWTRLPCGETVAFVDVPGHERFVPNMLAGVGPVPAALLVVAADEGWMPQSAEHLAALDALGVRHGLLAVTRTDLADPAAATSEAVARIRDSSLSEVEAVAVSATTGQGLPALRAALARLIARLPAADRTAAVRLWVDRGFSIHGSGTVVTGTLRAGTLRAGDELELAGGPAAGSRVRVRGLQALGRPVDQVAAVARVAVNLRGVDREQLPRGCALVSPDRFHHTGLVDVRVTGDPVDTLPQQITVHIGSAGLTARVRPLGTDTVRLTLPEPLPLWVGDRALLRDPGRHHIAGGITVLDVAPPPLRARGAARRRAAELAGRSGVPDQVTELRQRKLVRRAELRRMGIPVTTEPVAGDWLAEPHWWQRQRQRLRELVARHQREHPLAGGAPAAALCRALGLPERRLLEALVSPPLVAVDGRIADSGAELPEPVRAAVAVLRQRWAVAPFAAPATAELAALGLDPAALAAAERAGELLRLTATAVVGPDAPAAAVRVLAGLPQPFTLSQARQELDTSRRVAVPLLELLDQRGLTRRLADDRRTVALPLPADRIRGVDHQSPAASILE